MKIVRHASSGRRISVRAQASLSIFSPMTSGTVSFSCRAQDGDRFVRPRHSFIRNADDPEIMHLRMNDCFSGPRPPALWVRRLWEMPSKWRQRRLLSG